MPMRAADAHHQQGDAQRPQQEWSAAKKGNHAGKFVIGSHVTQAALSAFRVNYGCNA
jgi:hypothetical protein